ncbi:hypothetical protein Droror1_Dr00003188 [Drosera rotundifolia]
MAFLKSAKHRLTSMIKKTKEASSSRYMRLPWSEKNVQDHDHNHDHDHDHHEVKKGYVPMMVGNGRVQEKFMVRTKYMTDPSILALLEMSADEFGYWQQGVLRIPCEPDYFREIINNLSSNRKR